MLCNLHFNIIKPTNINSAPSKTKSPSRNARETSIFIIFLIVNIRKDINRLEIFPQAGFDADEKFGKRLDPHYQTRGLTLSKDYIVLYTIVEDTVRLAYLLPSKSDYMKLFKTESRYD